MIGTNYLNRKLTRGREAKWGVEFGADGSRDPNGFFCIYRSNLLEVDSRGAGMDAGPASIGRSSEEDRNRPQEGAFVCAPRSRTGLRSKWGVAPNRCAKGSSRIAIQEQREPAAGRLENSA